MTDFIAFRNIINEWYAKDISKKCRSVWKLKGMAGEPLSPPPYGYMKDPANPKRWIVDEEAAAVVRRIFKLCLEGNGLEKIAAILEEDNILTPMNYWISKGLDRGGLKTSPTPTHWHQSSIRCILALQEYCGDVINFKTYSKSFKNKKRYENTPENMAVFKDVHDYIIDRAVFERVQVIRQNKTRKKPQRSGEKNMFSGLLVCGDCAGAMNYHFNQANREIKYFNCKNNNRTRKTCDKTHYIRVDFLEQVVLQEIRRLTKFANRYEREFAEIIMGHSKENSEIDRKIKQKELDRMILRDRELDRLFERTYEDNVNGKISDERYAKMTRSYEIEQGELSVKIKALRSELEKVSDKAMTADMFISNVRKYTRAKKLNELMLNELVERIEVFHAEIVDGVKTQKINIHYNFIGKFDIPEAFSIEMPDITLNTRKGVTVNYVCSA